jgi:hypothetical protein
LFPLIGEIVRQATMAHSADRCNRSADDRSANLALTGPVCLAEPSIPTQLSAVLGCQPAIGDDREQILSSNFMTGVHGGTNPSA